VEEEEEEEEHDDASIIRGLSDVSGSDAGADSSDEDESDDDDDVAAGRHAPILATKLPSSKDEKSVRDRLERVKKAKKANKTAEVPAVLYVGRLPHGFYEKELRSYFSQFGEVTRLRLSRNKRTGAAKHYAFIEFADKDVATIVQETMDNYLIEGHLLQVRQVPKEKVHPKLWVGANRAYRKIPTDRRERVRREKTKTAEEQAATTERKLIKRQESKRSKLKSMGIDYEFQGYT
ncbi:RNA-binding domain-containing protein, partial [Violaceomyces palustris]